MEMTYFLLINMLPMEIERTRGNEVVYFPKPLEGKQGFVLRWIGTQRFLWSGTRAHNVANDIASLV